MNAIVLSREIRDNRSYTLAWTIIMTVMLIANTLGVVLPARAAGEDYDVPAALATGIANMLYCGPIFAMILGGIIISREEDEKTIEFLLAHPITRTEIAASKLLAFTVQAVFLSAVLAAAGLILIAALGGWTASGAAAYLSLSLSYFVMTFGFGAAGTFLSMFVVKGGAVVGLSIGIPMILAILAFLQNTDNELLRLIASLSPFKYLDVASIMSTARVDVPFVSVAAAVSAALLAGSIALYKRKEFSA